MIRTPEDPEVEGFEFRYKVIEVIGVMGETVFKGADTREFRSMAGAEKYAEKLMHRGRGWPIIIQVGKLLWLTEAGKQAVIAGVPDKPHYPEQAAE